MGSLKLENVCMSFGRVNVLDDIDLEVQDGEFVIFVGPSGCGKSTLLRIIAGLEDPTSGCVRIDGDDVTLTPPAERGVAMVFQSYALYPHLTVRGNMGIGLKQAGLPQDEIREHVAEASRMLSLDEYLDRRPAELSGGQRQRVAIGRAIVRKPKLFLFDEPLSNLDAALRVHTRLEIARLHRELKATIIYVTHDQVEAMTLGDRIVVLNEGRIEQIGTPMELYRNPVNLFVAGFVGSPQMNFIDAARVGYPDADKIGIRPEHISVDPGKGDWEGTVVHAEHLGPDTMLYLQSDQAGLVTVRLFGEQYFKTGQTLYMTPRPERLFRFDAKGAVLGRVPEAA